MDGTGWRYAGPFVLRCSQFYFREQQIGDLIVWRLIINPFLRHIKCYCATRRMS